MLKYRLPSGILMGLIVLGAIFIEGNIGKMLFVFIGGFLAYFSVFEYLTMLGKINLKSFRIISSIIAAVLLILGVLEISIYFSICLIVMSIVTGWFMMILAENKKLMITKVVTSFSILPALVIPLYFLVMIYNIAGSSGRYYLFFLIIVTKLGDVGAYTVGMSSSRLMPGGNHKILPKISPKKSWEGTIGGLCVSVIASLCFCHYVPEIIPVNLSQITFAVGAGALLFIGGFIGDLTESALKRGTGVKDSGTIIPGMGGALDVIDSLVLNAPLFYLFIIISAA